MSFLVPSKAVNTYQGLVLPPTSLSKYITNLLHFISFKIISMLNVPFDFFLYHLIFKYTTWLFFSFYYYISDFVLLDSLFQVFELPAWKCSMCSFGLWTFYQCIPHSPSHNVPAILTYLSGFQVIATHCRQVLAFQFLLMFSTKET